jgi:hypothetical protein
MRLPVLDGELCHHRTRPEYIAVHCDVVAKNLRKNPPGHQPPVQHLVTCPHSPLHSPILRRIHVLPRTVDFVRVAAVTLVAPHPFAQLEEITQNLVRNFNIGIYLSAG